MEKSKNAGRRKLRVMADANTLFSSVYYPRFDYEILEHSIKRNIMIVISPYIFQQALEAIKRHIPNRLPLFEKRFTALTKEFVQDPTHQEVAEAKVINLVRDPTDIPIAICAINAKVDYLITGDKDFTAEDETTKELRKRVRVIKSRIFLQEVMGWSQEALNKLAKRQWRDLALELELEGRKSNG